MKTELNDFVLQMEKMKIDKLNLYVSSNDVAIKEMANGFVLALGIAINGINKIINS